MYYQEKVDKKKTGTTSPQATLFRRIFKIHKSNIQLTAIISLKNSSQIFRYSLLGSQRQTHCIICRYSPCSVVIFNNNRMVNFFIVCFYINVLFRDSLEIKHIYKANQYNHQGYMNVLEYCLLNWHHGESEQIEFLNQHKIIYNSNFHEYNGSSALLDVRILSVGKIYAEFSPVIFCQQGRHSPFAMLI